MIDIKLLTIVTLCDTNILWGAEEWMKLAAIENTEGFGDGLAKVSLSNEKRGMLDWKPTALSVAHS